MTNLSRRARGLSKEYLRRRKERRRLAEEAATRGVTTSDRSVEGFRRALKRKRDEMDARITGMGISLKGLGRAERRRLEAVITSTDRLVELGCPVPDVDPEAALGVLESIAEFRVIYAGSHDASRTKATARHLYKMAYRGEYIRAAAFMRERLKPKKRKRAGELGGER